MSTTGSIPLPFTRLIQASSTTRKPDKRSFSPPPRKRSSNKNLSTRLKPQTRPVPLTEASTYTCLPPKDDFLSPSETVSPIVCEVKLSDYCKIADFDGNDADEVEFFSCDLEYSEDEEDEVDGDFGINYVRLDVFEGNSCVHDEDESEDLDDHGQFGEEQGEDEVLGLGLETGKIVSTYDSDGNKVTARLYTVGDNEFDGENFDLADSVSYDSGLCDDELQVKEKGVPAIMRCFDRAKIYVKAGDGGNGVVAFRREKFVPLGGPSGGDGGRGGSIYVEVDGSMNSLLPFRNSIHFRAGRGAHGQGKKQAGAKGEDLVVRVPPGTVIREAGKVEVLLELLWPGKRALLLPGGRGGRGNASFKSGTNKVPRIAENGEEGPEM